MRCSPIMGDGIWSDCLEQGSWSSMAHNVIPFDWMVPNGLSENCTTIGTVDCLSISDQTIGLIFLTILTKSPPFSRDLKRTSRFFSVKYIFKLSQRKFEPLVPLDFFVGFISSRFDDSLSSQTINYKWRSVTRNPLRRVSQSQRMGHGTISLLAFERCKTRGENG